MRTRLLTAASDDGDVSRSAWGRKNRLGWEVHGTLGMIAFEQERMNELHLFVNEGPAATRGFRTIMTGPAHAPFAAFVPAPGHQLGFNDLKVIEAADLLRAIAAGGRPYPDFRAALGFIMLVVSFVMLLSINLLQAWGRRRHVAAGR